MAVNSPTLDDIYDACERLDKDEKNQNGEDYALFIKGTSSTDGKVKKLSAQMIVRYWKNFSEQRNASFYALVGMLEDRDPEVRKVIIRELSLLVKAGQLVDKIADVLSQMLQQTDEQQEIVMLTNALGQCLRFHPKQVLSTIFSNIVKSDEESIRVRLLKFVVDYLSTVPTSLMVAELKEEVEKYVRMILKAVTAPEFDLIFDVLRSLETYQTVKGRIALFNLIVDQIGIDQPFPIDDKKRFDQILYFVDKAQTLLSLNCRSAGLVEYFVTKGIPRLDEAPPALRHRFLRSLADMLSYTKALEHSAVKTIVDYFLNLIPLMPSEKDAAIAQTEGGEVSELKLSEIEPLVIALFKIFKANRSIFDAMQEQDDESVNWRRKVVYFARVLQQYISRTNTAIAAKRSSGTQDRKDLIFTVNAVKMAEGILKVVKEFVHKNPAFTLSLTQSWISPISCTEVSERKRTLSSTNGNDITAVTEKKERRDKDFINPSRGKFSGRFRGQQSFVRRSRGRRNPYSRRR